VERFTSAKKMVGLLTVLVAAGLFFTARPVLAFWNQLQAGQALHRYLYNLPPQSGGFACLTQPLSDPAEREVVSRAVGQLEQSIRLLPNQAHTYYLLGRAYCRLGNYAAAVRVLPRFSELRPKNPQADLELGFALEKLCPPAGECEELTTAQVWQRAGVKCEDIVINGDNALYRGLYEDAVNWYMRSSLCGINPINSILYANLQKKYTQEGLSDRDVDFLLRGVESSLNWSSEEMRANAILFLNPILLAKNRFSDVINISNLYLEQTNCSNSCSDILIQVGLALAGQQKLQEGLDYMKKGLEINPNNVWGILYFGEYSYYLRKDTKFTDYQFQKAMNLLESENKTIFINYMIDFWIRVGLKEMAIEYCKYLEGNGRIICCRGC